ncbi:MAG: Molybdopterin synthase catalytic subunit MoaE, partial [uncultured Rubrobacteraceae bacterium]
VPHRRGAHRRWDTRHRGLPPGLRGRRDFRRDDASRRERSWRRRERRVPGVRGVPADGRPEARGDWDGDTGAVGGRARLDRTPARARRPRPAQRRDRGRLAPARPGFRGEPVRHRADQRDSAHLEARGLVRRVRVGRQPGRHPFPSV